MMMISIISNNECRDHDANKKNEKVPTNYIEDYTSLNNNS